MSTSVTKHISFPLALFSKIEKNANVFGVSFAEYLRHLAMNDTAKNNRKHKNILQEWENSLPTYLATEEEEQAIVMGNNEIKNGQTKSMTVDQIMKKIS